MGKKTKKRKAKDENPKPAKKAKPTGKPAKSAGSLAAPAKASTSQQGGGDREADPAPPLPQLGDPLPAGTVFKHRPKYWVHNLPDGYGKSAGLV